MQDTPLFLHPSYWNSGFRTQASNIKANKPAVERKLACLLETISSHILKHGHTCFASTTRLVQVYNENCERYGCRPITFDTLKKQLKKAEDLRLINRKSTHNHETGQNKRHITLCIDGIKSLFSGVYKYAFQAAEKRFNRQKWHVGGSSVEKSLEASSGKGLPQSRKNENGTINTKDLSKEIKNKSNNGIPSDAWFLRVFKQDANEVKELQLAAKQGRLSASGARRVIAVYNKHQQPLSAKFMGYLKFVIASWHNKSVSVVSVGVSKVAEYMNAMAKKEQDGSVEYYRDDLGRVQVRYL